MATPTGSGFGLNNLLGRAPAKPNAILLAQRAEASTNMIAGTYDAQKAAIMKKIAAEEHKKRVAAKAGDKKAFNAAHANIERLKKRIELRNGVSSKLEQAGDATSDSLAVLQAVEALQATTVALAAANQKVPPASVDKLMENLAEAMDEANEAIDLVSAPFGAPSDVAELDDADMDDFLEQAAAQDKIAAQETASAAAAAPPPVARPVTVTVVVESSDNEHLRVAELLSTLPVPSAPLPQMTPAQAARARALARN